MDIKATPSASESATNASGAEPRLGQLLTAAREKLGVSQQEAAQRAHLSLTYVEMLEGESYKKVSDQIYLVPFLRRYAKVLGLDGEDLAMRFVRDFQYVENESVRMVEPVILESRRAGRRYTWVVAVAAAVLAIALAKFGQNYYREQSSGSSRHNHKGSTPTAAAGKAQREPGQTPAAVTQAPAGNQFAPSAPAAPAPSGEMRAARQGASTSAPRASSVPVQAPAHAGAPAAPPHTVSDPFANNDHEEDSSGTE